MVGSLILLLRAVLGAAGIAGLIMVWRFVLPHVPGLFGAGLGFGELLLELSLSLALVLVPFALVAFAVRPAAWKFCAMPMVWILVATIILRPAALIG